MRRHGSRVPSPAVCFRRQLVAWSCHLLAAGSARADEAPVKIGFVTFLTGPAAAPFGIPGSQRGGITG